MFGNLKTDDSIQKAKDSVGGGNFGPLESNVYDLTIESAYVDVKDSGAIFIEMSFVGSNGEKFREGFCVQSGTAKGSKNYYEKDGEKHYLPGFNMANAIALLTVGDELASLESSIQDKVINKYSAEASKEVPTQVKMITGLLGQSFSAGVLKVLDAKTKLNQSTGKYEPVFDNGELQTREYNEIACVLRQRDQLTVSEIENAAGAPAEPVFKAKWLETWEGKTRDKTTKIKAPAGGPANGAPTGGKKKLFS